MKKSLYFCLFFLVCIRLTAEVEIPELHVLGWSKQGHFAYCLFRDVIDPLGGCTDFKLSDPGK